MFFNFKLIYSKKKKKKIMLLPIHHISCRVFWQNIKSPRWLSPLQSRFGALRLLAFPKIKITFERDWGIIALCTMFLVSSSRNISLFHITWLDTFWTDLIHTLKSKLLTWSTKALPISLHIILLCKKNGRRPGWCGSVDWVLACKKKLTTYSQSRHMPGL